MPSGPDAARFNCHAGLSALPRPVAALFGTELFDTREWYETTCAAALPPTAEALFVTISAGARPLALFPMRRDVTRLSALTTPYTCLWRPLLAPGLTAAELHGAARAFGRWCRSWGTVRLDALDLRDPVWTLLLDGLRESGLRPLEFDHFGHWSTASAALGWENYLAERPDELRETLRLHGKQPGGQGAGLRLLAADAGLDAAVAAFEAVAAASRQPPEPFPRFNAALMRAAAARGWLRLGLLEDASGPVAAQAWLVQAGRGTVLKRAHDDRRSAESLGTVLTGLMIRHLIEQDRIITLDFGRGDDTYKMAWAGTCRQRKGVLLANPWRVSGLAALARRRLRAVFR
jgi:hypothetical protein